MLDLDVIGDDLRGRTRDREDLTVSVIDAGAKRRRLQIHPDLADGDLGVVRVIDDLNEEESHTCLLYTSFR